ncbi:MAG: type IX secretion system protein PorQ [Tannerellaceae bacterium]|nr:type IX secretion system protein PorQ [Tannerellaceae bacterium]
MKNIIYILFLWVVAPTMSAQNGDEVFTFLRYPASSRVNALGGNNISLVERDPSLIFHNPALLGTELDKMVNLNYMNFISDINLGSALFTKATGGNSAWGVGAVFFSYGNFKQTTEENIITGNFSVKDIGVRAFYSRDLSERWRGGLSLNFLYASLESYTSLGLAVDAGLSYYHSESEFSFGIVLKNIGAQLKAYDEKRYKMPWDIQLGLSKKLEHAPFRFSLTAMYLNKWKFGHVEKAAPGYKEDTFVKTLAKHLVLGVDFVPSENFWVGIGFNPKTNMDMKLQGANALAGFSAGAGVSIKMFDIGASVAKYHPSALSLMISVSTTISDFKP